MKQPDIWEEWAYAVTYGAEAQTLLSAQALHEHLLRGDAVVHDNGVVCILTGFNELFPFWNKSQNQAWARGMTRVVARIREGKL